MTTDEKCRRCSTPFEEDGKLYRSTRRYKDTPFCGRCTDHCMETEIADHWCDVDRWNIEKRITSGGKK